MGVKQKENLYIETEVSFLLVFSSELDFKIE